MKGILNRFIITAVVAVFSAALITGCSENDEPQITPVSQEVLNQQAIEKYANKLKLYTLPDGVNHMDLKTRKDLSNHVKLTHRRVYGGSLVDAWQIWFSKNDEIPYYILAGEPRELPISANGHEILIRALYEDNYHIVDIHKIVGESLETYHDTASVSGLVCRETDDNTFNFRFEENRGSQPILWGICLQGTGTSTVYCETDKCSHEKPHFAILSFIQMPYNDHDDLNSVIFPEYLPNMPGYEHCCTLIHYYMKHNSWSLC